MAELARGFMPAIGGEPGPGPGGLGQEPLGPVTVIVDGEVQPQTKIDPKTGAVSIEQPDGSVVIHLNPPQQPADRDDGGDAHFYDNLAEKIGEDERQRIVSELMLGIQADDDSRQEWLKTRSLGIDMLGFKLEEPRSDAGSTSSPLEGMSSVRHPLLPEAIIRFQANAAAELLPADGPVKVRNDRPPKPPNAPDTIYNTPNEAGTVGGVKTPKPDDDDDDDLAGLMALVTPPDSGQGSGGAAAPLPPGVGDDDLAEALERDFNHYLTVIDKGYRADTTRMLFGVGFGGCAFKKVYNCPIKRRPVSRSVDAVDLIVSNDVCDLEDAGRITHRVKMRRSLVKRMQLAGAYRDVELGQPTPEPNEVNAKSSEVQGFAPTQRPEDFQFEIDEVYCELDIKGYEHKDNGEPTGLPLPYKVSIERASRQLLELRRNWRKNDDTYMPRRVFVKYGFVQALGFYDIGLLQILGNADRALTAAWREMLDAGMFASFPGFLYAKQASRQLTMQMRVPPGGGVMVETGGEPISSVIMPLPYKEPGPAMLGLIQHIEQLSQRLGGTAELPVGEGRQDAPVGTTLALIEQATKVIAAVHVGLHASQSLEFQLLRERFQEDPEAFWRFNTRPTKAWEVDVFLAALDDCDLVPAADPNTASHMHRIMKAVAIKQLQAMNPQLYDPMAVDRRILEMIKFSNPMELFAPPQPPGAQPGPPPIPPDPNKLAAVQQKAQAQQQESQERMAEMQLRGQQQQADIVARANADQAESQAQDRDREIQGQMAAVESADRAADRASRERVAQTRLQTEAAKLQGQQQEAAAKQHQTEMKAAQEGQDKALQQHQENQQDMVKAAGAQQQEALERGGMVADQERMQAVHDAEMQRAREKHEADMRERQEKHEAALEQSKAMAKAAASQKKTPEKKSPAKKADGGSVWPRPI